MSVADERRPSARAAAAQGTPDAAGSSSAPHRDEVVAHSFDGVTRADLLDMLDVPALHLFSTAGSSLDVAHRLALHGAPHGTVVIADAQTRGRGRGGKQWASPPGTGLWLTLIARPPAVESVRVLTVRLGLAAAGALDAFAMRTVRVKWPNDLYVGAGKLAGVLVEARWRGATPEWLAIGIGINVLPPRDAPGAAGLPPGTTRVAVLAAVVPALLIAAARPEGVLDAQEMRNYSSRDLVVGRAAESPARGTILGITPAAELLVATIGGNVAVSSGSLVLSEDA